MNQAPPRRGDRQGRSDRHGRRYASAVAVAALLSLVASPVVAADQAEQPVPDDAIQLPLDLPGTVEDDPDDDMGGPIDLARLDGPAVRGYALKHGISHQAAADAINWQATTLGHLGGFRATLGQRHVGSEFLGPSETASGLPELVLHVFLPTEADHAAAAQFPGPGITRIEESVVTRLQMVQRIEEAEAAAREANPGRHLYTAFDHATGEASVTVGEPYDWVEDGTCGGTNRENKGRLDGGRGFTFKAEDYSCQELGCTLGFSGYFNQKQGAVTAGHCVDDSPGNAPGIDYSGFDYNGAFVCCGDHETWMMAHCYSNCSGVDHPKHWASLRPYFTYDSRSLDAAFVREKFASTATSTNIYVAAEGFYNIIGFHDGSVSALGLTVCQAAGYPSSEHHGEHCGQIANYNNATWKGTSGHYASVDMFPDGTGGLQGGGKGSSGGPWYHKFQGQSGHDIIGLGVHVGRDPYTHRSIFTRVDAIFDNFEKHAALGLYCNYGQGKQLCRPVDLSHLFDWDQMVGQ